MKVFVQANDKTNSCLVGMVSRISTERLKYHYTGCPVGVQFVHHPKVRPAHTFPFVLNQNMSFFM